MKSVHFLFLSPKSISYLYVVLLFIFPSFFGYMSLGTGQLVYLLFIIGYMCISLLISFPPYNLTCTYALKNIIFLFVLISLLYTLTLLVCSIRSAVSYRDFFEPIRPLIYLFCFIYPLVIIEKDIRHNEQLIFFIRFIVLGIASLDLLKFNFSLIPLISLYSPFEYNTINYIRFSGTFGFCYNYGYILLFFLAYTLLEKKQSTVNYIYILAFVSLIVLTGSRAVFLGLFMLFLIYIIFFLKKKSSSLLFLLFFVLFIPIIYNILKDMDVPLVTSTIGYIERLFFALSGEVADGSLNTRQSQLEKAYSYFMKSPLLGNGPLKENTDPIEILLGYYFSSWGILGSGAYFLLIFYFGYLAKKCFNSFSSFIRTYSKANFIWILLIPIVGMSTPITDQVRVFNFFFFIQGIQYILYYHYKNEIFSE